MNEEPAKVAVASLGYAPKAFLSATGSLLWDETEPGGELSSRAKLRGIDDRCGDRVCCDRADAWDGSQATTRGVRAMHASSSASMACTRAATSRNWAARIPSISRQLRQLSVGVDQELEKTINVTDAAAGHNAELREMRSN
jgi:hypothetical protein